ncbi:uncharacterized protein [Hoplias malabaricus]|uniref:uncharacterized protein n=1 Tax=Hoplias malabaricus TaxID=27720 RepID=UPI003462F3EF
MDVSLAAAVALCLLCSSPAQGQGGRALTPGADSQREVEVDGENLNPGAPPLAVGNEAWPGVSGDLRQRGDGDERPCEVIPITDETPVLPRPTSPSSSSSVFQLRPVAPPVPPPILPLVPLPPSNGYSIVQSPGGAVGQGSVRWLVPGTGYYRPMLLLYPPGPRYVPVTFRGTVLTPVNLSPRFAFNPNVLTPFLPRGRGHSHRKQAAPHAPGRLRILRFSEEGDK